MKIGFIGCGNMASAIMGGIIKEKVFAPADIYGTDTLAAAADRAAEKFGIEKADGNAALVKAVDIVVLAVKPQYYQTVIEEIRDAVENQLVITIAPGKTLSWLADRFGKDVRIVRTMPNTPAMVGCGMTAMCCNDFVTEADKETAGKILGGFGDYEIIPEHLMDAVVAVSGSSPAYVFMMIEAMADAAVMGGMPRPQAYKFAAKAVEGSAAMVSELGKHPGELKDMVCSPAGTTIEAVRVLEEKGFRSALIESMIACIDKAASM
ncbi:MAG: pyrroline-5-carboxylate reductase [Emergencia sp.]|nr:pyrroline-5-carboxylate reductase [Emergencia sp.]